MTSEDIRKRQLPVSAKLPVFILTEAYADAEVGFKAGWTLVMVPRGREYALVCIDIKDRFRKNDIRISRISHSSKDKDHPIFRKLSYHGLKSFKLETVSIHQEYTES